MRSTILDPGCKLIHVFLGGSPNGHIETYFQANMGRTGLQMTPHILSLDFPCAAAATMRPILTDALPSIIEVLLLLQSILQPLATGRFLVTFKPQVSNILI